MSYKYNVNTYPVLWVDDDFNQQLNNALGQLDMKRPEFIRTNVWKVIDGEFDRDEFDALDCRKKYVYGIRRINAGSINQIPCVKDSEYTINRFKKRAKELGISRTELLRYALKKALYIKEPAN
ncbi:hypothetical protein [Stenotrophomonas acidaminiphila]